MRDEAAVPVGETIGERLKRLRLERGLSQRDLASPGVSYAYISRIEAGSRQPSVKALRKLAEKLGVSAAYLETGSQLDGAADRELRLTDLELAVRLGETGDAEPQLEELLADAGGAGDAETALRARVALAILAREKGEYQRMVSLLEAAVEGEPFAPISRAELYGQLGFAYAASGRPELAVVLFERCLESVREQSGEAAIEARYAAFLSYALSDAGDLERAEAVVTETLARVRESADPYLRVRLYWSLARLAHAENRAGIALVNARRAIGLLEATEDTLNLARAHMLAASISITREKADDATAHLDAAERLLGAAPSTPDLSMVLVKRAQVAALQGDGAAAVELARAALGTIAEGLPEERGLAFAALGDGLALEGSHEGADEAYSEAVGLLEGARQWRAATQACRAWARMLRATGREAQALDVLDRAAELGLRAAPAEARQ